MKKQYFFILLLTSASILFSQGTPETKTYGIAFKGFVKNDVFFDSRQTVAAREGHFLLWPSAEAEDSEGQDINAKPNFNMLAIQSRLSGVISGPDAFGAKTSALIEGDFFAQSNANINLYRLRHAFLKLKWPRLELLTGQYWNPLFVTACFPATVSFNTGTPLQSFARNPQIRLTYKVSDLSLMGALLSQRDYVSRGPDGASSSYLRNSALPDAHLQVQYASKTGLLLGAGGAYKTLVPRLSAEAGGNTHQVTESIHSLAIIAFAKLAAKQLTLKAQGRYGENIPDVLSISGFAVKRVKDSETGRQSYTPFCNASGWVDLHTNGKAFQLGLFGGYLFNLGTKHAVENMDMANNVYGLAANIESLLRVSPRIVWNSGKVRIAGEAELTTAAYGSDFNENYEPGKTTSVTNVRGLLSTYFFF